MGNKKLSERQKELGEFLCEGIWVSLFINLKFKLIDSERFELYKVEFSEEGEPTLDANPIIGNILIGENSEGIKLDKPLYGFEKGRLSEYGIVDKSTNKFSFWQNIGKEPDNYPAFTRKDILVTLS